MDSVSNGKALFILIKNVIIVIIGIGTAHENEHKDLK
jgi:hypothetical protein